MKPPPSRVWWRRLLRGAQESAPVLTLAVILSAPFWMRTGAYYAADGHSEEDARRVAAAVDEVPYRIGSWSGQDASVPEAANELLRPNALLSRRYVNLHTGERIDFLFVHCGDSRDMQGHYPPVCYPNSGWVFTSGQKESEPVELQASGKSIPGLEYRFSRIDQWPNRSEIRIFNFFVLPNGELTHDIDEVGKRINWLGASIQGVAQVQILTQADMSREDALEATTEILEGVWGLFEVLGVETGDPNVEI